MSENPEAIPTSSLDDAAEKPAAKKTAKKAAAKKAAKKTVKQAAKKAPVRKTAGKSPSIKGAKEKTRPDADARVAESKTPLSTHVESPATGAAMPAIADKPGWPAGGVASATFQIAPAADESLMAPRSHPEPPANAGASSQDGGSRGPDLPTGAMSDESSRKFGRVPGGGPVGGPPGQDGQGESRSKKRREKRKRKRDKQRQGGEVPHAGGGEDSQPQLQNGHRPQPLGGPKIEADGLLELAPKGFGFLRVASKGFDQARDDVFVPPEILRRYNLRACQWIHGFYQEGPRGPQLVEVTQVNGQSPEDAARYPHFDELKAVNPTKRISFETTPDRHSTRVLDIMSPVGRGQRGLIVSPPRSGKTTLLLHMAEAIREKYDEQIHLMVLLVDERPEEVTEFRRALPGAEIYASSNDEQPRNHCRIAELAIERAKRLVEGGSHVFLLMDSITRLARAYNNAMARGGGRGRATGTGGVMIGALEVPRRLFAAARNTRGGGSLTIVATALIQTNSRADEAIFMEFKGTGNMELVLDRKIAENYIYPAVDIFKSGTRREELLLPEHMLHKINLIRRGLSGHRPAEAMERLLFFQKKFPNNPQMLLEIKG